MAIGMEKTKKMIFPSFAADSLALGFTGFRIRESSAPNSTLLPVLIPGAYQGTEFLTE
jgi:hypothetical protein